MSDWRRRAACAGMAPSMFDDDSPLRLDAVAVCLRCPVAAECLADARANEVSATIRGGLGFGGTVPVRADPAERREYWRAYKQAKRTCGPVPVRRVPA
jgi:hypothetical protein